MAKRSFFKNNFSYFRLIVYSLILIYIWVQYEFSSGNWSYSNGQAKLSGQHLNGKDEGVWTWFYPNGKKQMQGEFINGKRQGTWLIWDTLGNKISETNYQEDKLNGNFIRWYANGNIESNGVYNNDQIVSANYFNLDGTKK